MIALTKTKVIAYLAAIFAAGVLAGGVGGYSLGRPREGRPPPPPDPKNMAEHTLERLQTRLNLTSEQAGKIRGIVEQSFAEAQYRSGNHFKEIGEVFRKMNAQITEQLNAQQKEEFDRMEKERRDKRGWGRPKTALPDSKDSKDSSRDGKDVKPATNCPAPGR